MNAHAVCQDDAADSALADSGRDRDARPGYLCRAGLLRPSLAALVLIGAAGGWPALALAAGPANDRGHVVKSGGAGSPAESFDSVLLQAPGSPLSETVIAEGGVAGDGVVVTDDAGEWPAGTLAAEGGPVNFEEGPVTFSEGLQSLCPGLCCHHGCCCGPRWSVQVDALMLWRSNMQSVPLFLDPVGGVALDANAVNPPLCAGPRVGVVRRLGPCAAIEGNYFNVSPFAGLSVSPPGGPFTMTNFGDLVFDDIGTVRLGSNARIQSAELNWRESLGPAITWIAGFRWVQWNEQMTASYAFANPTPDDIGSGSVTAGTGNDLYGGQIGIDAVLWDRGGSWQVNGLGKAGAYYNVAYQNSTAGFVPLPGFGPPYDLPMVSASDDVVAFFGEVGLNSTYWLKSWLAWRVGYSLFWLDGVAVASQQFPLANYGAGTTSINTNGSVLLHGVTTGLEARW